MAQSTTSRHLRVLAEAGLVEAVPGGVWTVYKLPKRKGRSITYRVIKLILGGKLTAEARRDAIAAQKADRARLCRQEIERKS